MINFEGLKKITVHYSTENIPAPFCYSYQLQLDLTTPQADDLALPANYQLEYTDREELEEDEIFEEGFTINDDFSWTGHLPPVWLEELKKLYLKTSWHIKEPDVKGATSSMSLQLVDSNGKTYEQFPSNKDSWEYFLQEMIQAIYEISKKEMPLEVKYKEIDEKKEETSILIQPFFSSRTVNVIVEKNKRPFELKKISWSDLKPILKSVYFPDYDYEYALEKVPNKIGKYIDHGEGVWYEFGVGVKNPDPKTNSLERLERSLKDLIIE